MKKTLNKMNNNSFILYWILNEMVKQELNISMVISMNGIFEVLKNILNLIMLVE